MNIEIKPAEIVGASIGDRVVWTTDKGEARSGTLTGLSTTYPGRLTVNDGDRERHVDPSYLHLAPKKYAVGDQINEEDKDRVPRGTLLLDVGYLPAFKDGDGVWHVLDVGRPAERAIHENHTIAVHNPRTIAWLPKAYTEQSWV